MIWFIFILIGLREWSKQIKQPYNNAPFSGSEYVHHILNGNRLLAQSMGLIAARPKGVRTPPQTPKKKACGGCTPSQPGVQTPARPPPHAARRPHAYKWREDGRLSVRPHRTGVLAMHACLEGVQALHALRTGVHGWHACPARLT
ncbi:hypothetical protein PCANC_01488 [Puccinia coronata f. sp. avenae]|uniref:Uncharacterized protein n=1 Tax=Puccinia coronata f. sp. avenae TaxID=200324 RepID=A0A2N5W2S4_9BASI|nr:hypothetical protein PCANC_01488 [Puccinia coronata f. sp. avenae]